MKRRTVLAGLGEPAAAGALGMPSILRAQTAITLNGASQFNDDHAFTKALVRFEELVNKYYGKPVNSAAQELLLGLEKQYFEYMAQGKAVDYGIVSPAHMSTFSKAAPFIDAPSCSGVSSTGTRWSSRTSSRRWPRSPSEGGGRADRL